MEKVDFKKQGALYALKKEPAVVDVPAMRFIMIDGRGNPNNPDGEYPKALELLYGLTYTIKMMPKSGETPPDYFEYVIPPLEGLWDMGFSGFDPNRKDEFIWTSMIRQPEFVTSAVFDRAKELLHKKKPQLALDKARLVTFTEGLCAQILHVGAFDDEPPTVEKLHAFIAASGHALDMTPTRRHHEIYFNDPRRCDPGKAKALIRLPIK